MTLPTETVPIEKAPTDTILIAGIGNIFLGDDAFGSEVARRLTQYPWPEGVRVVDFGIRGLDLAYDLMDGDDVTILIDAVARGGEPGTLYLIEPDISAPPDDAPPPAPMQTHNLDPATVIRMVHQLGGQLNRLLLVGCEPTLLEESIETLLDGLTPPVAAAVDRAIEMVVSLVEKIHSKEPIGGDTPVAPSFQEMIP